ncbi:MAG: hypothetical protein LUF34_06615 [Lachnospiraceae bacterium]|nr:hypothetical protein [Lachnospiraceae bacterium]
MGRRGERGHLLRLLSRQILLSPRFILPVLVCAAAVFVSQADVLAAGIRGENVWETGYFLQFVLNGLSGQTMYFLVPILSAVPGTAAMMEDVQSGFLKPLLSRTNRRDYLTGRILSCSLAGAAVFPAAVSLALPPAWLFLSPWETGGTGLELASLWRELAARSLLLALSGALWAGVGLWMSLATGSLYAAYSAPFVFYYVGIILYERYLPDLAILCPSQWIWPGEEWPGGVFGGAGRAALRLLLVLALAWIAGERRGGAG